MPYRLPFPVVGQGGKFTRLTVIALAVIGNCAAAAEPVDYARQVKPVLKQRCYACHGALKQKAGLRLDTGASIRRGGPSGPAVEPGHAAESTLIDRVTETELSLRMPPEGSPLTAEQIALLRGWIDQGAKSSDGEFPEIDPREHWAFRKPVRPTAPDIRDRAWARNPIDAFLARPREEKGMSPLPAAEPHVLLRRLYLDLIGLPPSRDELHAFLADPSEAVYRRDVDRLLNSPQYGERWARHWMDVWRYSDWYGRRAVPDVLNSYAQIWRWRDWIVRSLNADKGYDRMIQEMLAADELAPDDPANLVATGFLVRNWYRWNYNLWMKDNVEHTGKALLGLTFNCAHCHDHKYDPIKHEDYFAFRAFFEPLELRHDRVPGEPDPGPYPKYEYGKAYPPIKSGMVRVFDEKLDAKTFLYTRGESRNVVAGKPPIAPGVPAFLGGESLRIEPIVLPTGASPARSTGRRAALARWITDRGNPLAARVAVNHLWRWHFGTPLVATTSDFGRNGKPPTHPALLDWLAVELMEPSTANARPWSFKAIHRLIVTSAAYRMGSHSRAPATNNQAVDPDNALYWRFQPSRMEAEEIRDSLLHVAGELDTRIGGADIDFSQGLVSHRRSLYFTHHGEARMPFLELFDAPDACDCYRRTTSIVPQQALALVNNDLLATLSRTLADRLWLDLGTKSDDRDRAFVNAAFEQVLARAALPREQAVSLAFLARQARMFESSHGAKGVTVETGARARGSLILGLFSHNDFITIH